MEPGRSMCYLLVILHLSPPTFQASTTLMQLSRAISQSFLLVLLISHYYLTDSHFTIHQLDPESTSSFTFASLQGSVWPRLLSSFFPSRSCSLIILTSVARASNCNPRSIFATAWLHTLSTRYLPTLQIYNYPCVSACGVHRPNFFSKALIYRTAFISFAKTSHITLDCL